MSNSVIYPSNPSIGDEFEVGRVTKVWDGEKLVNKDKTINAFRTMLIAQGLSGNYGFFKDGFEYKEVGDVGIHIDNTIWMLGAGSITVNAGTIPSEPEYKQLNVNIAPFDCLIDAKSFGYFGVKEYTKINWLGRRTPSDGGGNWGVLRFGTYTPDEASIISVGVGVYIQANVKGKSLNVRKCGAFLDGINDDTPAINLALSLNKTAYVPNDGTPRIDTQVIYSEGSSLTGNGVTIEIHGDWIEPAILNDNKASTGLRGLKFKGVNHSSTVEVVRFLHDGQVGTGLIKGPKVRDVEFSNFTSNGVLYVINAITTDSDWTQENEPDNAWATWRNPNIKSVTFEGNKVPLTNYASPSLAISGTRAPSIKSIIVDGDEERGISIGYCTDVSVSNIKSSTKSNGNVNSNPHPFYIRTSKRVSLIGMNLKLGTNANNCYALRLSRGVFDIIADDIIGYAESGNTGGGGLGSFGANRMTMTNSHFKTPANTLVMSGHASTSGNDGYTSASFADCSDNFIGGGSTFECTTGDGLALSMTAVSVPQTEPVQPKYTGLEFTDVKFINRHPDCIQVGKLKIGDGAKMKKVSVITNSAECGLEINRDNRISASKFGWSFSSDCDFIREVQATAPDPLSTLSDYTAVAILYTGNSGGRTDDKVLNCNFKGWYAHIINDNGQRVSVRKNEMASCNIGYRLNAATPYLDIGGNNINNDVGSGHAIGIFGDVQKGRITANDIEAGASNGIRFGVENSIVGLQITRNLYRGTSKFLRDTPNELSLKITSNDVDESVASDKPSNPTYEFNSGF